MAKIEWDAGTGEKRMKVLKPLDLKKNSFRENRWLFIKIKFSESGFFLQFCRSSLKHSPIYSK